MSIHKLHIFAKNRDAVAAQKGYAFQQYKTLEQWINNRIANNDEIVFCDYEDDILARDIKAGKTKFKQIKLYSTDFSFSSESIQKALAHFFMLYVKGEYAFDETEFHFETNASIVGKEVKGNDAKLLKDWYEHQGALDADLLTKIAGRVKVIIDEYIAESLEALKEKDDLKSEIQAAKIIYDSLKEEDFEQFVKCIKWQFEGIDSNTAVDQIVSRIEDSISKISVAHDSDKASIYIALLIKEVFQRSIKDDPAERSLTANLLDQIILGAGEKEDQWYAELLPQFRGVEITAFFSGEFQSAITGARYCRWNLTDENHKAFWLEVLEQYIKLDETPIENKKKAIYEFLFLKIGHDFKTIREQSPIENDIDLAKFYIDNWEHRFRLKDIEDDIALLQILKPQTHLFELPISYDDLMNWQSEIQNYLDTEISLEKNVDRLCELLEVRGHLAHQEDIFNPSASFKKSFEFYRKIPPLLKDAHLYSLSRLYDQLDTLIKLITKLGINPELIEATDEFMIEIQEFADKAGLRHKAAKSYVERGALHLETMSVSSYLSALELFHKAKGLWRLEITKEGYILALLNVAQVYLSLGMSYAAKYYAMSAFWSTWHFTDPKLYKHLPKALNLVFASDFSHGAWMNAIDDFEHMLSSKREFDEKGFDFEKDDLYQQTIVEFSQILQAVPIIHPEMSGFITALQNKYGVIWDQQLKPVVDELNSKINSDMQLKKVLNNSLRDYPLTDIGKQRIVRFNALGCDWKIVSENSEILAPVLEEFTAFLQVFLCEIARLKKVVLNPNITINIHINQGHFQKKKINAHDWVVTIPAFDSNNEKEIQTHYTYLGVLIMAICQPLTTLTADEFRKFYMEELMKKNKLDDKAIAGASYQRIFKHTIGTNLDWNSRSAFNSLPFNLVPVDFAKYLGE